jgi:hypothetical protein
MVIDRLSLRSFGPILLAFVVQGCASTMSKNQCVNADWYQIGYESGVRGQVEAQFGEYRKACAEYGVTPDLARYLEGRKAGLKRFCEPGNGYRLGQSGTAYGGVCSQPQDGEFRRAYGAGRELYDARQNINRLGRRIDARQADLKNLSDELADKEAELIATGTTPQRRALLLSQLVELRDKVKLAERDIHYARVERDRERERLAQLQRRDPPW